jgi:hypothetical protein
MRYMLLVYLEEHALSEPEREHCYQESLQLTHELKAKGQYLAAAPLYPTATASSIRMREGKPIVTDGPFAETREQLGGYYLVDVKNQQEAVEIAARIPGARFGTIEVRQVIELTSLPDAAEPLEVVAEK